MATTKMIPFAAFLCLALLLLSTTEVDALCKKRSTSWTGICFSSSNCNRQCKSKEHANYGACHRDGIGSACFCYKPCPCKKRSTSWSGFCGNSSNCDKQCKRKEHAQSGACHRDGIGFACFCYFKSC
ncbi:hypothetical protein L6164_001322 [Bauhinia variegata]|uniref:Uncharacterized protein n=1 Tax=Bauhinia variegata TaxID=167791 RepID=A0ACB9Q8R6_BAUVA|nr:hypothetical protein L6164_001322 [Bauhinia variegata]